MLKQYIIPCSKGLLLSETGKLNVSLKNKKGLKFDCFWPKISKIAIFHQSLTLSGKISQVMALTFQVTFFSS